MKIIPVRLGQLALIAVLVLFFWDAFPTRFPPRAHNLLGALPLSLIAFTYLLYQAVRRPIRGELLKAVLLAAAFLFWAANQFWPGVRAATLFNDLAIGLFVFDVFLVVSDWPATSPAKSVRRDRS